MNKTRKTDEEWADEICKALLPSAAINTPMGCEVHYEIARPIVAAIRKEERERAIRYCAKHVDVLKLAVETNDAFNELMSALEEEV